MFLGVDLAHWEFLLLILGVAIAAFGVAVASWGIAHVRPIFGTIFAVVGGLLAAAAGVLLFVFSGVSIQSPIVFPSNQQSTPKIVSQIPMQRPSSDPTVSALLAGQIRACTDETIALKKENARLRERPRVVAVSPSPCASVTPMIVPSHKMGMDDCRELLGEQALLDSANQEVLQLSKDVSTDEYKAAVFRQNQAADNLNNLANRLCQ
jgi:hypothetical protein